MKNAIAKGIASIFGTKTQRDLKELNPYIKLVTDAEKPLFDLSNDELRQKTRDLEQQINEHLQPIDDDMESIRKQVNDNPDLDINEKDELFKRLDELEEQRDKDLEDILLQILPDAFAVMRQTARRFKENSNIYVTATEMDRRFAAEKEYVSISGNQAVWKNSWKAAGSPITWDMVHYDVQIVGGVVLHQGKIAEMATGEGKTLVANLPTFLNALARRGVHIVTVNDYLAKRDAEWMGPLFEFHGLTIDCIDKYQPNSDERRAAYAADITYGTNNEFGFDYLRDNMSRSVEGLVQRKHHFAMVDEVDSVLIDDARTPLIISGPIGRDSDEEEFYELKPRITKLFETQKQLVSQFLQQAKKLINEGNEKEGGLALFRAYRGLPKYKPLIKYLSETGIRQIMQKTENFYLQDNGKMMPEADAPLCFTIDEKNNSVDLTEKGIEHLTKSDEDAGFFVLPDIGTKIAEIEKEEALSDDEKLKQRDTMIQDYSVKAKRIHTVNQLLKAYALFEKEVEYIVQDNKVKIVDEQTGRVMDGRRYSDGLHQAIEAKENVKVEEATQTYATITLQNYFRMYHKLAGMTGTAETEAGEFWDIYELDVVVIPTNKPIVRDDKQDKVFKTAREKFNAVIDEIQELTQAGRPVLVGTTSVEVSELLSRMLNIRKLNHQVLNAKQHAREADVVAEAGKPGTVTVATNMAGRGTDIKLAPESKQAGGLAIIGTERHESRRVDRQLRGRSGRQGDVGSSQFFVSLEDNLMRMFNSDRVAKIMDRMGLEEGEVIQHSMVTKSIERAQKKVEENNFAIRKRLLEYDDVMNQQREVIYTRRKHALYGERLQLDIMNMMYDTCEDIVANTKGVDNYDSFKLTTLGTLGIDYPISQEEFTKIDEAKLAANLYETTYQYYREKNKRIAAQVFPLIKDVYETKGATYKRIQVPFTDGAKQLVISADLEQSVNTQGASLVDEFEKAIALALIDENWKEHLREMDDLKQSVQNAVYEQKDPLIIYKFEGFELFKQFLAKVNEETISFLLKAGIPIEQPDEVQEARAQRRKQQNYQEQKADSSSVLNAGNKNRPPVEPPKPAKTMKVAGRNDKVTVQYTDGTIKKDVKYKKVEEDIRNNRCVLIDEA